MTAITVYSDKTTKDIKGFEIKGHAGFAKSGEDIVCAAISILAINTQNAIEQFCEDSFKQDDDEKSGLMKFWINGQPSHDAQVLLKAAKLGFVGIAKDYDKYVTLKFKEV